MVVAPTTLLELRQSRRDSPSWLVSLVLPEIGGGRLDRSELAVLDDRPEERALKVSGLDQGVFEVLISEYATQFSAIEFWKCPRITDLGPVEDLPDLERGETLRELGFGDAVWSTSVFESLEPVAGLERLQSLRFTAKKINDGRIERLGHLRGLTDLSFPSNLFTTRQVAWLRAHLPGPLGSARSLPWSTSGDR